MSDAPQGKFGFVALVGRPNAGKSTLLNRLVGEKISIVTHKPQTTRHRILGIVTTDAAQVAFVDTPGLHRAGGRALNRRMNQLVEEAFHDVDRVLVVVDATTAGQADRDILERALRGRVPVTLVLNKIDRLDRRERLLALTTELVAGQESIEVFYISATSGDGVEQLMQAIVASLPAGEPMFDTDDFTDRTERFLAAERIREQLLLNLHQEIPYGITVSIERFQREDGRLVIHALIHVTESRYKGMVIGKGGSVLKRVGTRARQEIADLLGCPVHLELHVRVDEGWTDSEQRLRDLGYY